VPQPLFNLQGATFSALSFLGLALFEGLAGVAMVVLLATGRRKIAARVAVAGAVAVVLYLTTLLVYSLASREQVAPAL
jgi:hypothetical protein